MTATTDNRRRSRLPDHSASVRERAEEPKRVISQIVLDAMNSAIPEGWEVADHAAERILSALPELGKVERLRARFNASVEMGLEERAAREAAERARDEALERAGRCEAALIAEQEHADHLQTENAAQALKLAALSAKLSDAAKALEQIADDAVFPLDHPDLGLSLTTQLDVIRRRAREVLHQFKGEG